MLGSDALESLLAHELGHIVLKDSKWWVRLRIVAATFCIPAAAAVCCFGLGLAADHDGLVLAGVAGVILGGTLLSLMMKFNRMHEREADAFAVRVTGLRGIEELMKHNAGSRSQPMFPEVGSAPLVKST